MGADEIIKTAYVEKAEQYREDPGLSTGEHKCRNDDSGRKTLRKSQTAKRTRREQSPKILGKRVSKRKRR